jgi:hypothetical protein
VASGVSSSTSGSFLAVTTIIISLFAYVWTFDL